MDFCLLLKLCVKILVKIFLKSSVLNAAKNFLIKLKKSATNAFKIASKKQFKKQQKKLVI